MATKKPTTFSNCTFTSEAFKPTPEMMRAVSDIAMACAENARALARLADRITGPVDNRTSLRIDGGDL
jgi:hypothetical protein